VVIALIDEAMVTRGQTAYVLVAVLLPDARRTAARSSAQRIVPRRRRFHFHQEEDREKRAMMALVALEAQSAHAVFVAPASARERESTRQRLLLDLASGLPRQATIELTIESREPHNDRLDRITLLQARRNGVIPADMTYEHRQPVQEPLLWLADAFAGAVRSGTLLRDTTWLERLPERMTTIRRLPTSQPK